MVMNDLVAWEVSEDDHGAIIVFAPDENTAREKGASRLGINDDEVDIPERCPAYDAYAPGPVPVAVLLANGWWFECYHCRTRVYEHENEEGDAVSPVPGPRPYSLFCSPSCAAGHGAHSRAQAAAEAALIETFESRYPGAEIVSLYVRGGTLAEGESVVRFRFPGGVCQSVWHFGEDAAYVSKMDVDAFKHWLFDRKEMELLEA